MPEKSEEQVRQYLAYWFQLGKKAIDRHGKEKLLPQPVFLGNRYSREFEECWQKIITSQNSDFYLEGTEQRITDLVSSTWEIVSCARCEMPVPIKNSGVSSSLCPCNDLPDWPNFDLPQPRSPINRETQIGRIRNRLKSSGL
ncbi:hypothetical protein [Lusitaniella coriacea]|uniref:hypothetical protein n=1 Tax=Lusitaniella coriacea TaxID=1983105 RepID=UPI003CF59ABD